MIVEGRPPVDATGSGVVSDTLALTTSLELGASVGVTTSEDEGPVGVGTSVVTTSVEAGASVGLGTSDDVIDSDEEICSDDVATSVGVGVGVGVASSDEMIVGSAEVTTSGEVTTSDDVGLGLMASDTLAKMLEMTPSKSVGAVGVSDLA